MTAPLLFSLALALLSLVLFIRNRRVHSYLNALVDEVASAAKEDVARHRSWEWRFDVIDSVKYGEMVVKFWKPLPSFFPDKSFINPDAKEKQ